MASSTSYTRQMPRGLKEKVAAEWPEMRSALMDLVSTVIMHPENGMDWFVLWCREHVETVAEIAAN
jgi:hypothetical protein